MQECTLRIPHAEAIDIYNPPAWWASRHAQQLKNGFVKSEPPAVLAELFDKYSAKRTAGITQAVQISGDHLLGLVTLPLTRGECFSVMGVVSNDRGRSWDYLSIVAKYDAAYIDESIGEADGFCEPAMVRLPTGDLLVILRMGSGYPLYSVRSSDDGETWSQPEELPARSIDPKLVRMDTGILALLTGRPDVTLHLSMDDGKTWPYQATLLRSTERRSTSNTALVQVGSGKLLCVFDRFHTDETAEDYWLRMHGDGEVVGCFVDITTSDCQPVKQEQKVVRA